jgi:pimeloyl-ACP methyl ester carboxylesterase
MTAVDVSYAIDGTGPPLYMVHGIGSRKTGWNKLLPYLLDRFTCVTYDLRGHGASPVPPTPYSLDGGCNLCLNQFIASEIPTAELVILDGVKHSILIEAPDRVAAPVREFLLRISQDR